MPNEMPRSLQRQLDQIEKWQEIQSVGKLLIDVALAEPDRLKPGMLKELVNLLSQSMNIIKIAEVIDEEGKHTGSGELLDVRAMRDGLISMWEGIQTIASDQIKKAKADPLNMASQVLGQLTTISRRSIDMLAILEKAEQEQEEEAILDANGGMLPEEARMLREWEDMMKENGMIDDGGSDCTAALGADFIFTKGGV